MSIPQIDNMRQHILQNLKTLELQKHLIRSHDRVRLMTLHNAILDTLNNMINIRKVEMSDPYNQPNGNLNMDPRMGLRTVVYNPDGTTRIVDKSKLASTGEGWEMQFDQSMLLNPPCYTMPPYSLSDINAVKRASEQQRMMRLERSSLDRHLT